MKIFTLSEIENDIKDALDLQEEEFISLDELARYINEGLNEAESEIMELNQDYFLAKGFLPLVSGTNSYDLPNNIYANKIRGIMYMNGSIQYPIDQYRRKFKFADIANTEQFGVADDYRYFLQNDVPGQAKLILQPTSRDTAVLAPYASRVTPAVMWYIRNCSRVPMADEYCNPEVIAPAQVSIANDTIQTYSGDVSADPGIVSQGKPGAFPGAITYITGDAIMFEKGPGATLPSPLVEGTVYYAIATGSGLIKVATSYTNAIAGTAINLTAAGTIYFIMTVAATAAIQRATLLDIPEFSSFVIQWTKCRCYEKEMDPRLESAALTLKSQKQQMIDTLTQGIEDDDNAIQMDFSSYFDMN